MKELTERICHEVLALCLHEFRLHVALRSALFIFVRVKLALATTNTTGYWFCNIIRHALIIAQINNANRIAP